MCSNKNGVAADELHRTLGISQKSAWFMTHRIRETMKQEPLAAMLSGTVVADETYIGGSVRNRHKSKRPEEITFGPEPTRIVPGQREKHNRGPAEGKVSVLTLVNRKTGEARSRLLPDVTGASLRKALAEQVDMASTVLNTDEAKAYKQLAVELAAHRTVNHSEDEYVRHEGGMMILTNEAENFFSQLKRSIDGTHHHVSTEHLPRYLAEFDFRFTTRKMSDSERTKLAIQRSEGRRLAYRPLTAS